MEARNNDGNPSESLGLPHEIVSKFIRDVFEGRISLKVDMQNRRPEDIELISSTSSKLILYLNDYLVGAKAGKELEVLERQLSFSISVLQTFGAFKMNSIENSGLNEIRRLELKIDSTSTRLDQLISSLGKIPVNHNQKEQIRDHDVDDEDLL